MAVLPGPPGVGEGTQTHNARTIVLYVIRHALTLRDPSQPAELWDLDPAGLADLQALRLCYPWHQLDHWYVSPERKTLETARRLTDHEPVVAADLREVKRGEWTDDYLDTAKRLFADPTVSPAPGWESGAVAQHRFDRCVAGLVDQHPDHDIAVVTHGLVISLWRAYLRGTPVGISEWRSLTFPDLLMMSTSEVQAWRCGMRPVELWRSPERATSKE